MKKLLEELKGKAKSIRHFSQNIRFAIKKYPELMCEIIEQTKFLDEHYDVKLSLRVHHIWTGEGIQLCPVCGEKAKKISYQQKRFIKFYDTCCCIECIKAKKEATNLDRYGHINPFGSKIIQTKIQAINLEKYGHTSPMGNPEVRAKMEATNLERYGHINPFGNPDIQTKLQATNLEKYGHINPFGNPDIQTKLQATNLEKYGHISPIQNPEVQAKIQATNLDRYGHINPFGSKIIQAKREATNLEKYGNICPIGNSDVQAKSKATYLKNYSTEHPMQNLEYRKKIQKSMYNTKPYTLPSGTVINLQGYEHFYLDKYFANCLSESDIQHEPFGIPYEFKGKNRTYYPDIFIPSKNLIVEVKSVWTLNGEFDEAMAKRQACLDAGYNFQFVIYDPKGKEINFRESLKLKKYVPKKSKKAS